MTIRPTISGLMALLVPAAVLAGCTGLVETTVIDSPGSLSSPSCQTALGSYYLPKAVLTIKATSNPAAKPPTITVDPLAVATVADRDHLYCLDYLSSPTSKDALTVNRNEKGLLQSINSNVEDRTPQIAIALIQTAENLAITASREGTAQTQTLPPDTVTLQFDPFAWRDVVLVKKALRRFGLCLYVEGFSFPTEGLSQAQVRTAAGRWCATDQPAPYMHPLYQLATSPVPPDLMRRGILYRPKTAYKIVILAKADPGSATAPWELYQTQRVEMPNASPVLAIEVERALFAKRITSVNFSDGSLTDVAVDKDSEAAGFVQIPLVAAQAIADVPGQIMKFRIADVQSHAAIVNAQGSLLNALASYSQLTSQRNQNGGGGAGAPKSASYRNGQFLAGCLDASNNNAIQCRDLQRNEQ
jgi:hypothetical protein